MKSLVKQGIELNNRIDTFESEVYKFYQIDFVITLLDESSIIKDEIDNPIVSKLYAKAFIQKLEITLEKFQKEFVESPLKSVLTKALKSLLDELEDRYNSFKATLKEDYKELFTNTNYWNESNEDLFLFCVFHSINLEKTLPRVLEHFIENIEENIIIADDIIKESILTSNQEQRILLIKYLENFNLISLNKLHQDTSKQALLLSFLMSSSHQTTRQKLGKSIAELTTKKNLKVLLSIENLEKSFPDLYQKIKSDYNNISI